MALAMPTHLKSMSRVTQFTNPLGVFNQTYDPVNLMPKTLTAPNGLTTTLDYHPAAADLRLKEIKHMLSGNIALSKHVYDYKPAGNIKSWAQTLGTSAAKTWAIAYDKADQLEAATQTQGATVTAQQAFRFDKIGNITSKQNGAEISKSTFNNRNQLTTQGAGGWMRVRGVTNESSSVRVKSNANPFTNAQTDKDKAFFGWVETVPGQNTLTVEATDDSPNANKKTSSYTINVTGQSRVPTYDLNGNMTANGLGQSYQWDAENRLVKITYADNSKTEFTYDGLSRRVRITERNASNTITADKRYLWSGGNQPAEERETNGTTVSKRYFPQGEQRIGGADAGFYYYTKDHLGSVREITNSSGALATRYDFDLWGKRTKLTGSMETEVGFTGHHHHAKSGLVLTWFRAYDADAGRWLSPDPLEEAGGMNLYGYIGGDPINGWDPYGLECDSYSDGKGGHDYGRFFGDLMSEVGKQFGQGIQDPETVRNTYAAATFSGLSGPVGSRLFASRSSTMTVSRWGRQGLEPGDWVMKGGTTLSNYLRSFKWQPGAGNQFAARCTGKAYEVARESVKWPKGWGIDGWWKGLFGQRIYKP
jgi:RHS repeat-associated protein